MFGIVQIILWIYTRRSKLSNMSTYTKIVFIILTIQLLNTLFIVIIFSTSYVIRSLGDSMVRSIVFSVLVFIAVVTALLIAFVKEISDTFPLNVITLFIYPSAIIFYILTDILLFAITIFISQITVGKLQLRIFCTEYTLAALLLYNMFTTTYLTTTGMICNITSTCNSSNASIYPFNNLPGYII
ncbi:hypothetical protein MS3_00008823 [Schistosoma haematobium]|uniref:Uncharacterized protein n=1 Tax=Schistosoma haematobium TaxID=6185 RepID=A0A922IKV0_SCHHA|nr:hypothetical protein MS3_00008823 [Schistosoma haematobium]KAH9581796.1 hypothetical protein MS3_00008823 [Schistosoma haematobium]